MPRQACSCIPPKPSRSPPKPSVTSATPAREHTESVPACTVAVTATAHGPRQSHSPQFTSPSHRFARWGRPCGVSNTARCVRPSPRRQGARQAVFSRSTLRSRSRSGRGASAQARATLAAGWDDLERGLASKSAPVTLPRLSESRASVHMPNLLTCTRKTLGQIKRQLFTALSPPPSPPRLMLAARRRGRTCACARMRPSGRAWRRCCWRPPTPP